MTELVALPDGAGWQIGATSFVFDYGRDSTPDRFLIRKPADLVARYVDLAARFAGARIVELGIAAGGSTALLALLAEPELLVACEIDAEPVRALAELIDARALHSVVRPFYDVDQADRRRLSEIVDSERRGEPLDLVIDDASHLYDQTLASFDVLFPRLRPGGWYLIEDWAADYAYAARMAATLRDPSTPAAVALQARLEVAREDGGGPTPLPRIAVELVHLCGAADPAVGTVTINPHWIVVERGPAPLDPEAFRLADHVADHWGWLSHPAAP